MKRALLVMVFAGVILASMYMEGSEPQWRESPTTIATIATNN